MEALKSNDKFLQGKIASGLAHVLLNTRRDDPRLAERLRQFRDITDMTAGMDNHTCVTPQWDLIRLPTNYYGVAFSVARLRMLLGWEDGSASKVLLEKMTTHYATYSGKFGFSDETPGEGRF